MNEPWLPCLMVFLLQLFFTVVSFQNQMYLPHTSVCYKKWIYKYLSNCAAMTLATYMNQATHARNYHNDLWKKEARSKI